MVCGSAGQQDYASRVAKRRPPLLASARYRSIGTINRASGRISSQVRVAQLAVAPDANRCVAALQVLYFFASRLAPVNRGDVRPLESRAPPPSVALQRPTTAHPTPHPPAEICDPAFVRSLSSFRRLRAALREHRKSCPRCHARNHRLVCTPLREVTVV
jgi:hypothetical protein